jgi:ABC-type Zn uptake system ZnuABC Zn-binding protein ZnuA
VRLRQVDGEPDPHIWQDPRNAMVMAANIERGLARVEPDGAGFFQGQLDGYLGELKDLDAEVEHQTAALANRKVVTNHDAFGYYLDRYHWSWSARSSPASTARPSCRAETIGREAGVKVVTGEDALYGDSLGPFGSDGDTYIRMVRHNTRTIVSNLSGT